MNTTTLPLRQLLGLMVMASLAAACGQPPAVTCGVGTLFDKTHNECVKAPDLNVIVADFQVGDFQMSQVDVPEQLQVGSPDTRHFTIKNVGTTAREVVLIRYAVSPVKATIEELRTKLGNLDATTDLGGAYLGQVIVKNLAVGEQRTVEYYLAAPASLTDGLYGFYFTVDEVPLKKLGDNDYQLDYSDPSLVNADGTTRLSSAALVYAPATLIIGKPDKANLRVLFSSIDNSSFLIDQTERGVERLFTASARMSAQGLSITEPVTAGFDLKLPGHVVQTAGKDLGPTWFTAHGQDFDAAPDDTVYVYDANRTFHLLAETADGLQPQITYAPTCRPGTPSPDAEANDAGDPPPVPDECAVIFNDDGRDGVYQLHLGVEDTRLLGRTRKLAQFNPGLDAKGELTGTLTYTLSTTQAEYQNNLADNVAAFNVVFMAPTESAPATEADKDNSGVAGPNSDLTSPYPFVLRADDSSNAFGNDWFGASYRNSSIAAVDKRQNVAVSQYRRATATIDGKVLKTTQHILSIDANSDWSTLKAYNSWGASANIQVWGYTLLNAQFSPAWCKKDGEVTYCPLFEAEPSAAPKAEAAKSKGDEEKPKKKAGRQVKWEKEFFFQAGPVPLTIEASAGITSGMTFSGKFLIDETGKANGAAPFYGMEFAAGPYVSIEASVFGGVTVGLAKAGVEGSLSLIRLEFTPLIRPKAKIQYDVNAGCFNHAEFAIDYEGPFTLSGPSGTVSIVAYVGRKNCVWKCWKVQVKVLDVTIASFSSPSRTWNAWSESTAWAKNPGDVGMCPGATPAPVVTWRSPTSCAGSYCNSSSSNRWNGGHNPANVLAAYKVTYDAAAANTACAVVKVTGITETTTDRVVLYDANGAVLNPRRFGFWMYAGYTGDINQSVRVCSPRITAALETDGSVARSGVTVTFTPSL